MKELKRNSSVVTLIEVTVFPFCRNQLVPENIQINLNLVFASIFCLDPIDGMPSDPEAF
jgi:hypothetical protein